MPRITKGMIQAAISEINCICDLANEAHQIDRSGLTVLRFHADSASRYIEVLRHANVALPDRVTAKQKMLQQCGWRL